MHEMPHEEFEALVSPYSRELYAFCYKMVGCVHEAEDVLQDVLIKAWKHISSLRDRTSVRAWLYKIASTTCLNHCSKRSRSKVLPFQIFEKQESVSSLIPPVEDPLWIEPFPTDHDADPSVAFERREKIKLAFVVAYQILNPQQRGVLILRDVLEFSAKETAEILGLTPASVNSSLLRARKKLQEEVARTPQDDVDVSRMGGKVASLAERFLKHWMESDVPSLVTLMRDDVLLSMPPFSLWYRGVDHVAAFFERYIFAERTILKPLIANEQIAFAAYRENGVSFGAHAIVLLSVQSVNGDAPEITGLTSFLNPALFSHFGLPPALPDGER